METFMSILILATILLIGIIVIFGWMMQHIIDKQKEKVEGDFELVDDGYDISDTYIKSWIYKYGTDNLKLLYEYNKIINNDHTYFKQFLIEKLSLILIPLGWNVIYMVPDIAVNFKSYYYSFKRNLMQINLILKDIPVRQYKMELLPGRHSASAV